MDCIYIALSQTDPMATKALYILPHIHPFIQSFIYRQRCQPIKAPSSSSGAAGVRCLAHGHLNTWSGGTGDWATNLSVCRQTKPDPLTVFRFPKHHRAVRLTGTLMMQSPEDEEPWGWRMLKMKSPEDEEHWRWRALEMKSTGDE